ncbi:toprim domain-containing protein [Brevundimonas sp. SL130]|uniref:toprim domain-containing protein n=1 Tax=Brevundimonas sp. SL130 TaxID=2995143 RepID=UPI00226D2289|nr:toprim domain-containing protein [Brevundimonas sp. SL130]WAC61328.1 toprim domain-containing protein [Brevundimonas sp. SL130]
MSLHAIVAALGGDLYQGGRRANVPAPGHSAGDRSISLLVSEDRVVIHSFGAADWRAVRDHLAELRLIDGSGRIAGVGRSGPSVSAIRPDRAARVATAQRLWNGAGPLAPGSVSHRYLVGRSVELGPGFLQDLRHHPDAPVSVFQSGGPTRPALVARITDAGGRMTAVELVYLDPNGRRADRLRLPRKTVGVVPPGSAVRLSPQAQDMIVGEGVLTVLSACERFGRPGWALMSAHNLSAWVPPQEVGRILIAADRGVAGERAAARLRSRLCSLGVAVSVALPPEPFEDWNAAATGRKEGGR